MLASLRIENFAIVKKLELDFANGMTAFTGETGAGKSIMIDALMLALGERADSSVIRPGEEKCDITATFFCAGAKEALNWLAEQDINSEEEVILRRVITTEGRSKSYINGQPLPLQKVKEFSEMLVHIHGQHQHQTLMQHTTHRQHLDCFAGNTDLLNQVQIAYRHCQKIKNEITELEAGDSQHDRVHLLQFQIEELTNLNIEKGEIQRLNEEHQLLHHAQDYLCRSQQLSSLLNAEEGPNICHALNQCLQILAELPDSAKQKTNAVEMLSSALIQCEEAIDEIENFAQAVQLDPERLQQVENRLSQLHHTARKYHVDVHELSLLLQRLTSELEQIEQRESRLEALKAEQQRQLAVYSALAAKLTQERRTSAARLAQEISAIIRQLGMPEGYIQIEITPLEKMQAHGMDKVEYKVCTNPGMSPDSLGKIASGGELSRISLAIQMITAQRGATPTLLFDEVDVGIGGGTAALVGQLLRKLGERLQVFCVTHQPQVAAAAHHHFLVQKQSDGQNTFSSIHSLNDSAKIDEIARMLGGIKITEKTLLHARELLAEHA